jgi:hypothetical protein
VRESEAALGGRNTPPGAKRAPRRAGFCLAGFGLAGLLVLLAPACGGGGSSGSTTTTPVAPPPVVRDGATDALVAADVQPSAPVLGQTVTIRAPGFLVREQRFDGQPIRLWPDLGLDFIRALSYSVAFQPGVPSERLIRWTAGFSVTAPSALLADPAVRSALEAGVAETSRASGLPVTIDAVGPVVVRLDAADPFFSSQPDIGAFTVITARSDRVESAQIVVRDLRQARRRELLAHELGHVLGLSHVADSGSLMFGGLITRAGYTERELLCLRMMYAYRNPGNRLPDRDGALAAAVSGRQVAVFSDCGVGAR